MSDDNMVEDELVDDDSDKEEDLVGEKSPEPEVEQHATEGWWDLCAVQGVFVGSPLIGTQALDDQVENLSVFFGIIFSYDDAIHVHFLKSFVSLSFLFLSAAKR